MDDALEYPYYLIMFPILTFYYKYDILSVSFDDSANYNSDTMLIFLLNFIIAIYIFLDGANIDGPSSPANFLTFINKKDRFF